MIHELDSNLLRPLIAAPDVSDMFPTLNPQQGDNDKVLLGKIAALLADLKYSQARSGVILDEAGQPRAVLRTAPQNIAASATDTSVVALVAGFKIRVISIYALAGATATNLTFNSKGSGSSTPKTALLANAANGGEVLGRNIDGWFETIVSEGLTVTTGSGATTGFGVNYILVPNYAKDENGLVMFDENGTPLITD